MRLKSTSAFKQQSIRTIIVEYNIIYLYTDIK